MKGSSCHVEARERTGGSPPRLLSHFLRLKADRLQIATPARRSDWERLRALVERVDIEREQVTVVLHHNVHPDTPMILTASASLVRSGRQTRLVPAGEQTASGRRDEALVRLVATAHTARRACADAETDIAATAAAHGFTPHYFAQLSRLGGLAPDIVTAVLEGRQPASLTRTRLARTKALPLDWTDQRTLLGFS